MDGMLCNHYYWKDKEAFSEMIDKAIQEVKLTKVQDATALSGKSADLTFNISKKELLKAACCFPLTIAFLDAPILLMCLVPVVLSVLPNGRGI